MRIHRKIDRTTFAGAAEAPLRPGALGRVARQNRGWLALYALLGSGELKGYRNGRVWRIPKLAVQEYILRGMGRKT